jgi:hypothetical protein
MIGMLRFIFNREVEVIAASGEQLIEAINRCFDRGEWISLDD